MSSSEGEKIGASPMILRSRKLLGARRCSERIYGEPFWSRTKPLRGRFDDIEKSNPRRRSTGGTVKKTTAKSKKGKVEKNLKKRRSSDSDIILKGKDIEKKVKNRRGSKEKEETKSKKVEKNLEKPSSSDVVTTKKRRSSDSEIILKGKEIEKNVENRKTPTVKGTTKGKDIEKKLKKPSSSDVVTTKKKESTEGVTSKGKNIEKKIMKKRRDTTPGWGCGGVMTIRPTESQRLIREISSLEVDTSKKRKRTPTKIFSPTDKDMVMDRKLRKRRKTTEGPFSENIEKKKEKKSEKNNGRTLF